MALVPARGDFIDLSSLSRPAAAGLEAVAPPARGEPALARPPVAGARGEVTPLPPPAALAKRALMLLAVVLALFAERAERADMADLTDSCEDESRGKKQREDPRGKRRRGFKEKRNAGWPGQEKTEGRKEKSERRKVMSSRSSQGEEGGNTTFGFVSPVFFFCCSEGACRSSGSVRLSVLWRD